MDLRVNSRRNFFAKIAGMAVLAGAPKLLAQQAPPAGASTPGGEPIDLVVQAAAITHTMVFTTFQALVPMTATRRTIMS